MTQEGAGDDPSRRRSWEWRILLAMYFGYGCLMLCRNTLGAASATMIQDPSLGLDLTTYGQIVSWSSLGGVAGKLVTGVGADRIGGRRMFLITIGLTAASTAAFGFVSGFFLLALLNFLGQFFKSGGWPAMTKVIGEWYPTSRHGTVWSIISTSSRAGTITAGVLLGWLLITFSWRQVFFISAGVTCLVFLAVSATLLDRPEDVGLSSVADCAREGGPAKVSNAVVPDTDAALAESAIDAHPLSDLDTTGAFIAFVKSPRFWLAGAGVVFLTMMMDIVYFLPSYLQATLGMQAGKASMASSAFPVGAFLTLFVAGPVYDRLSRRGHVFVLGGLLVGSVFCVAGLLFLPGSGLDEATSTMAAMGLLFGFGVTLSPAYYLPSSVFSIAFGGRHSGFLVNLLDIFGYAAAFVFTRYGGSVADSYGWPVFLQVLLGISIMATVTMTSFLWLEHRAHEEDSCAKS